MVDPIKYPTKVIVDDLKVPSGDGNFVKCGIEFYQAAKSDAPVYFLTNDEYYQSGLMFTITAMIISVLDYYQRRQSNLLGAGFLFPTSFMPTTGIPGIWSIS